MEVKLTLSFQLIIYHLAINLSNAVLIIISELFEPFVKIFLVLTMYPFFFYFKINISPFINILPAVAVLLIYPPVV